MKSYLWCSFCFFRCGCSPNIDSEKPMDAMLLSSLIVGMRSLGGCLGMRVSGKLITAAVYPFHPRD